MTFAERSRCLRKEKGLSQVELAKALNVSKACISMIEIGKNEPTAITLIKYADFFECSIDYLLGREDDFGNITIAGNASQLPADAQELVDMFLSLSPAHRIQILEYTKYFTEREAATKKRS